MSDRPTLRSARHTDIPQIVALARDALAVSRYADLGDIDEPTMKALLVQSIGLQNAEPVPGSALIAVAEAGGNIEGFAIIVARNLYEVVPVTVVTDIVLYARPGAHRSTGRRLMGAMHTWARKSKGPCIVRQGFHDAIMPPARAARMAERAGMRPSGVIYEKDIVT